MLASSATSDPRNSLLCSPSVRPSSAVATASAPKITSVRRRKRRTVARAYCPAVRLVGSVWRTGISFPLSALPLCSSAQSRLSLEFLQSAQQNWRSVESPPFCLKQRYRHAEAQDMPAEAQNMLSENTHPLDICLILRAHGEQRWVISEVGATVRQLECDDAIAEDQIGAALAYLEVLWLDACKRAAETDAAREQLERDNALGDPARGGKGRPCP